MATKVPNPIKSQGRYWIPPLPPHWEEWVGHYDSWQEAKEVRDGLEVTINGIQWKMMMLELEESFERQWRKMEQRSATRHS